MPASFPLTDEELEKMHERIESGDLDPAKQETKNAIASIFKNAPLHFFRRFCPEHTIDKATGEPTPSAKYHEEIIDLFYDHNRVAIAAPRGHAKSTVTSFAFAMHEAIYGKKDTIVLISASENQAIQFLERIKNEIETNHRIKNIFGDLKSDKWSATHIKLTNGTSIFAKGRGAQIRGLIEGASRPDLVILDDIEDEELVRSELRRSDLEEWLNGSVMPGVEPKVGKIICIGTILHMDSLLNRLLNDEYYPDFVSKRYQAIKQPGDSDVDTPVPLWPERFSLEMLEDIKDSYIARHQLSRFFMEYQNDPIAQENATFKPEYFQFFEELPTFKTSPGGLFTEVFIDMGGASESKSADPTAIIVAVSDDKGTLYVEDYKNKRYGNDWKPFFDDLFNIHARHQPSRYVFEKTAVARSIEGGLKREMLKRGVSLNYEMVNPTKGGGSSRGNMSPGKYHRISSMEADFKLGQIKMRKWMTDLQEQLISFPRGQHDDLIDALGYANMKISRPMAVKDDETSKKDIGGMNPIYPGIGL